MSIPTRITFSHIKNVIISARNGPTFTPLGRWSIDKHKNTGLVVDYSNEDHCGSCGEYLETVRATSNTTVNTNTNTTVNTNTNSSVEKFLEIEYSSLLLNVPN